MLHSLNGQKEFFDEKNIISGFTINSLYGLFGEF